MKVRYGPISLRRQPTNIPRYDVMLRFKNGCTRKIATIECSHYSGWVGGSPRVCATLEDEAKAWLSDRMSTMTGTLDEVARWLEARVRTAPLDKTEIGGLWTKYIALN
ncbi:MAG TPA: hypothetical protein PKZ76_17590 [Xanthomonadaceae bacterium]|nr:hypothetical protein [Xanthomonadaceae bacterium]